MAAGLILLDGGDCADKTTLAQHLQVKCGARVIHSTYRRNSALYKEAALNLAFRLMGKEHLVVLDRHWPSELIYDHVFRTVDRETDRRARIYDDLICSTKRSAVVLCVPSDIRNQIRQHAERRAAGSEMYAKIDKVATLYADLAYGNIATPIEGYLGELIHYGGMATRRDCLVYDWNRQGADLDAVVTRIFKRMR